MTTQLRPISDLQRALRFDDYDLTANRGGLLSNRQRWKFLRIRLLEHILGALTVAFVIALIANIFNLQPSAAEIIYGAISLALATLAIYIVHVRHVFSKSVVQVRGKLSIRSVIPLDGLWLEEVAIGSVPFYLRFHAFDVLEDGATYNAYYLHRPLRIGGNQLLSLEFLEPSTDEDDDYED